MHFFDNPVLPTLLALAILLGLAEGIRRVAPGMARLGLPSCVLAGTLGLIGGPEIAGLIPFDASTLESGVYHGLAIVFIALSLQTPQGRGLTRSARAMGFAIPTMIAIQTLVGLGLVGLLSSVQADPLHPGFGLILSYGFEQGPGQALALGSAWEASGMTQGSAVGLIVAATGFGWAILGGIPLIAWTAPTAHAPTAAPSDPTPPPPPMPLGAPDRLALQAAAVGVVYALTWAVCWGLSALLASMPDVAAMIWGFHFLFGAVLAMPMRGLLHTLSPDILDDALLDRMAGTTVDFTTTAAIAAIQLAVLSTNWFVLAVITTGGGLATLLAVVLIGRRGFTEAPREHLLVWFGMSTGTLPMGLALLRSVDPHLKSPAPSSAVAGSAMALPLAAPLVLFVHPLAITQGGLLLPMGLTAGYLGLVLSGWWLFAVRETP